MKFPKVEIDVNKFYNIGTILFGIIALMNTLTFVNGFINPNPNVTIAMYLSSGASLAFNYLLFGFFSHLKSTLPPKDLVKGTEEDMFKALKEKKEVKI